LKFSKRKKKKRKTFFSKKTTLWRKIENLLKISKLINLAIVTSYNTLIGLATYLDRFSRLPKRCEGEIRGLKLKL
jgi:hypothetical protein